MPSIGKCGEQHILNHKLVDVTRGQVLYRQALYVDANEKAIKRLETGADAVLGPCEDGGFYLLGLRRCPAGWLDGIRWSQPDTREQTRNKLESAGLAVQETPAYFDVDRLEDLRKLWRLIESTEIEAKETQRVFEPGLLAD